MRNGLKTILGAAVFAIVASSNAGAKQGFPMPPKSNPNPPIVYVESQGLYYDSIVLADLPFDGTDNWQLLDTTPEISETGLETNYGPGDVGYFGGRWFVDMDGDELPSVGDVFFLCPLLGPGREDP